uniref:G_PROTEIN_RECEP_F1_2 domain-containing protein n=1 Tax=Elaeophora elaphi TaxID=1147741 RepID=A0A0R3RNS7_9BILA
MAFPVNETATENISEIEEETTLELISRILHTYAYVAIGALLVLVNIPVFLIVVMRKALRESYLVLAAVFFNGGLTGMSAILVGTKRIFDSIDGENPVGHHQCVLNVCLFSENHSSPLIYCGLKW